MIDQDDLLFLADLKRHLDVQASREGGEVVFHVIQVNTAMTPDFSGIQKVEGFTGSVFLTRLAAEAFVNKMKTNPLYEKTTLEIRTLPLALCPEVKHLLGIVQKMLVGI